MANHPECLGVIHDLLWERAAWVFPEKMLYVQMIHSHEWGRFEVSTFKYKRIGTSINFHGGLLTSRPNLLQHDAKIFWTSGNDSRNVTFSRFCLLIPSSWGHTQKRTQLGNDPGDIRISTRCRAHANPIYPCPGRPPLPKLPQELDEEDYWHKRFWTSLLPGGRVRGFHKQDGEIIAETFGAKKPHRRHYHIGQFEIEDVHPMRGDLILVNQRFSGQGILQMLPRSWAWRTDLIPSEEFKLIWTRLGFRGVPRNLEHPFEFRSGSLWAIQDGEPRRIT
jgi:hypothetical protein